MTTSSAPPPSRSSAAPDADRAAAGIAALEDAYNRTIERKGGPAVYAELCGRLEDLAHAWAVCPANVLAWFALLRQKLPAKDLDALDKLVKRTAATLEAPPESGDEPQPRDLSRLGLPDLVCPPGYTISRHGVWTTEDEQVATGPLVITGRSVDVENDTVRVDLSWRRGSRWVDVTVARSVMTDARQLNGLTDKDAPIDCTKSRAAVAYLSAFESANEGRIPEGRSISHMGWSPDGRSLLVGHDCYGEPLQLADEGLGQRARGWRAGGSFGGWCATIREHARRWDALMLAIYASAAAPLLSVVGQGGFYVDFSGDTSLGKSTALQVAASVWGVPSDKGDGIVGAWKTSSTVGPMVTAWFLQSLPVILDDTQHMSQNDRDRRVVATCMYDIPGGQEQTRGTASGGLREVRRWCTVMLSSGEEPITAFGQGAGGAAARGICWRSAPLGDDAEVGGAAQMAISDGITEHHGHLGRLIAAHLVTDEGRAAVRADYVKARARWLDRAETAAQKRAAGFLAVLDVASELCHALGLPRPSGAPLDRAWDLVMANDQSDPPRLALQSLYAWCSTHSARMASSGLREPTEGWAGTWRGNDLVMIPAVLDALLTSWGYRPAGIVDSWRRRGWLETDGKHRGPKVTVGAGRPRCVVIKEAALKTANG